MQSHPAVLEAAVVGAPDEVYGEVPVAYVATYPGTEVNAADLLTLCVTHPTRIKVPVALHVADTLPKNPIGKIDKPRLRALQARIRPITRDGA